jgi:hypothetical protein
MLDSFKRIVRSGLLQYNISISKTPDVELLGNFFSRISPIDTDKKLIRLGGESDGGYLVPDDLSGCIGCFSPGVSTVASFESDLADRGVPCFMADYSVDAPPIRNKLFDFEKKFLGTKDSGIFITLGNWVSRKVINEGDLILQMDIEGAEYRVILNASSKLLRRFRVIIIEFHRLDALFSPMGLNLVDLTFEKLLNDFEIVHIHPNNCADPVVYNKFEVPPVMEFTFLRKDRVSKKAFSLAFPHPLDRKNLSFKDDIVLPECWRGQI